MNARSFSSVTKILIIHKKILRPEPCLSKNLDLEASKMTGVKGICLRMQGGFCNRLRAIISGVLWAEDLGLSLNIYWPVEPGHMACSLEEIIVPSSIPCLGEVHATYLENARQILCPQDMKVCDEIRIKSYSEFHPEVRGERGLRILRGFRFVEDLEEEAQAHWNLMGGETDWIGVHYRGTDHLKCMKASPLSSFFKTLDSLPSSQLFLATDEFSVKGKFISQYGKDRVAMTILDLGRVTKEQQKAGIIEWLLLQKCGMILGSLGSSYSEMAALRSGCIYIAVTITPKESIEVID